MSVLKLTYTILFIFILSKIAYGAPSLRYSIQDLEVLEQEKSYEEFLRHARDIRPTKRDKHWKEMVYSMAIGYIDEKIKSKSFNEEEFQFIEKLALWPSLKKDEFFVIKRQNFAGKYFAKCFEKKVSNKGDCVTKVHTFWYSSNKNPELASSLNKLLSAYSRTQDNWKFIKVIINSNISEFYCSKDKSQKLIFEYLYKNSQNSDLSKLVDTTMNQSCWREIVQSLKNSLYTRDQSISMLSYNLLKAKNSIDQRSEDLFLAYFILHNPIKGDIFNRAWNRVLTIGQNYKRRKDLVHSLKVMDPLPGRIFSNPDLKKRKTIIRFLSQNIPEYIDYYAKTCIDYLKGNGEFPTGNPTIECPELFQTAKGTKWVEQKVQTNYSAIKRP